MDLITSFNAINWLSVVVATVAAFAVGSLWYSPLMFTKIWQKEVKLSDEDIKNANMGMIFGSAFVLHVYFFFFFLVFFFSSRRRHTR